MISYNQQRNHGLTSITFGSELSSNDDVVVASTTLESNSTTRHLSIVGPSRMDYGKVKSLLDFIKEELEKGKFN
jgi:heat-inducible transcriptional repressor